MLELRPTCELCEAPLPPESDTARMCTYECTFCVDCATWKLLGICPNCGGELVIRPRRPADKLRKHPASTQVVHRAHDLDAHEAAVRARLLADELPPQTWLVSFVSEHDRDSGGAGYDEVGEAMAELARRQPGFLGVDSVERADGVGVTVSAWSSVAAMVAWRRVDAHGDAQARGRARWYRSYRSDVARVERTSRFAR
jgi:uncharacterized protein